jgi:hypothetical protein
MAVRNLYRGKSVNGTATPTNAPIYVDSDDNILKHIPAGSGSTEVPVGQIAGSTAGIGYATGAGGAVTQATNASTGVELNKPCGQITTVALTTAAAAEERFTVTNSLVVATDVIALSTTYNGAGTPMLSVVKVTAGAFDVVITNVHAANALDALMVINFAVIKAVAA